METMEKNNSVFGIAAFVIGAVAITAMYLGQPSVAQPNITITSPEKDSYVQQLPQAGAASGPDTYFPYVGNNDVRLYSSARGFTAATTTVCAQRSPVNSTSTLVYGSVRMLTSSTTASVVTIAKATTAYATTTLINTSAVAANAQVTLLAASTTMSSLTHTNNIFAPGTYVVVGMQGGNVTGGGTFTPVGECQFTFLEI